MAYTTINKSTAHFNTKLYTGNGSTQSITGVGFKPDWVWVKQRGGTTNHKTSDIVRGVTKALQPNDTDAEATDSNGITAFNSDGFSLGAGGDYNSSSASQVAWNWLAGGSQGSSNTDGSINTAYTSVNTTAGFSISKYTGTGSNATVGHGLGAIPKMIIVKKTSASQGWHVQHASLGATKEVYLNTGDAAATGSTPWNNTTPTASVFSVGTSGGTNGSSATYIAYCFAEKQGYSKFGSYVGNGNANGTMIYTGFKPAWVMVKNVSGSESWHIWDNKRSSFNLRELVLYPNGSSVEEDVGADIDMLSNGFKLRSASTSVNGNGNSFIYMAFAEAPLVGTNNVPCTAI